VDPVASEQGPVAGPCEEAMTVPSFIKGGKFLD
jgi:hypothetical protein